MKGDILESIQTAGSSMMRSATNLEETSFALKNQNSHTEMSFNCNCFSVHFDFIMAQSILTHCGPNLFRDLLASARQSLGDDGLLLFSIQVEPSQSHLPAAGWHYPHCVGYSEIQILDFLFEAGLWGVAIPW